VEKKKLDFEDIFFLGHDTDSPSGTDYYESASSIADDLRSALLAELELSDAIGEWEKDLSLLSNYSWVSSCRDIVERLIQLREISPLDIVAISALTERVSLRPLLCSLALALRRLLQRVVLIDCDLRVPSLHTVVAGEGREGFIDMIKYGCSFSTVASETETQGIYVIGAGSHPVSSEGELVGTELERVFHSLRTKADITLACVPPFLIRKRVNPILNCTDGLLLCVNRPAGRKSGIRRDLSALWRSDIPILGIVTQTQSQVEERQTLVLRARAEDVRSLRPQAPAENARQESKAAENVCPSGEASGEMTQEGAGPGKTVAHSGESIQDKEAVGESEGVRGKEVAPEKLPRAWQPISCERDETLGASPLSQEIDSHEAMPRDESELVENALFGRQRRWGQYVIGVCAVLAIIGVLALKQERFSGSGSPQMDERMMRSILLPGSDGVTTGDETQRPETAIISESSNASRFSENTRSAGTCVLVSSRANYGEAAKDSLRVAGVGFRVSIKLTDLGEHRKGYRVVAGPFPTADEAKAAVSRIEPLGLSIETKVITEGVKQ
jgi:Mrp family chromosome partitioning ATPase